MAVPAHDPQRMQREDPVKEIERKGLEVARPAAGNWRYQGRQTSGG